MMMGFVFGIIFGIFVGYGVDKILQIGVLMVGVMFLMF